MISLSSINFPFLASIGLNSIRIYKYYLQVKNLYGRRRDKILAKRENPRFHCY
jgi:hypothetical protein